MDKVIGIIYLDFPKDTLDFNPCAFQFRTRFTKIFNSFSLTTIETPRLPRHSCF